MLFVVNLGHTDAYSNASEIEQNGLGELHDLFIPNDQRLMTVLSCH